jgi:uncharacterized protein YegP (UPF0339 family)
VVDFLLLFFLTVNNGVAVFSGKGYKRHLDLEKGVIVIYSRSQRVIVFFSLE